jgi:dCMP deaminase
MNTLRPSWDEYFINLCDLVATRATCDRKQVGSVIVKNNRIISTGYNGAPEGLPHCNSPDTYIKCSYCYHEEELKDGILEPYSRCINCYEKLTEKDIRYGGHDIENDHCLRVIHSEVNAISQAARVGIATEGATIYCNTKPCYTCLKIIISAGIKEVVYKDDYDTCERTEKLLSLLPFFTFRQFTR